MTLHSLVLIRYTSSIVRVLLTGQMRSASEYLNSNSDRVQQESAVYCAYSLHARIYRFMRRQKGTIMKYEEFVAYVKEVIRRNKIYEDVEEREGDADSGILRVRVEDVWGERTSAVRLEELYEAYGQEDKSRIRMRVRQLLPWDGRGEAPLTSNALRQMLPPERQPMFDSLRLLRQAYARRENVAPYVIFSNHVLLAMCTQGPETMEELQALPGVGKVNSVRYGEGFLELIRYHNQKIAERRGTASVE